jgi:photosystem II stability/assembly factor-like uncharacterized protein
LNGKEDMTMAEVKKQGVWHSTNTALIIALGLAAALVLSLICVLGIPGSHAQTQPTIVSVSPDTFVVGSQDVFTITGSGFEDTPTVTVDFQVLVDIGFVTTTTLTATVPLSLPVGVYTVTVTNPGGLSDSLTGGLTIQNPTPTLLGLSPDNSIYGQTADLTITGTHFVATPTVSLDETPCPVVQYVSSTTLTATVPGDLLPGVYDLTVTNPGPNDPHDTLPDAFTLRSPTPTITAISPNEAPNNLDTQAVITGTSFVPTPTVTLGETRLEDVAWVSSTRLTALVPWGMDAGTYDLTIANPGPGAPSVTLTNAFTVEQAIGVWTTAGPYGGTILDIAVSPVTSQTAYAAVGEAGLFRTRDGGDTWNLVTPGLDTAGVIGVLYGPAPTHTLYYWGFASGLQRSGDDGETWELVISEPIETLVVNPQDERYLWIATGHGDVRFSTDGGAHWEIRSNGLPTDSHSLLLAVHPVTPSILYAGTGDGQVFKTTDEGLHWYSASNGLPPPHWHNFAQALAINPFAPDVLLFSRWNELVPGYRSIDGGETWVPIDVGQECGGITDLAFSPYVSGTVYASSVVTGLVGVSTDSGATWTPLCLRTGDLALSLGLDPTSGAPVYLGGGASGAWRSYDSGQTCELATDGITGLPVEDVAASPIRPETVYVAAGHVGGFVSNDAGHSWRQLPLGPGLFDVVEADPQHSGSAYFAGPMYHNPGGDAVWVEGGVLTDTRVQALAVVPVSPAVLYAGGCSDAATFLNQDVGRVFRSLDNGKNWTPLDFGQPISRVTTILVHPVNTQTLYIATACGFCYDHTLEDPGLGVFRSDDGGETWQPITQGIGQVSVWSLVINPDDPQILYAGAVLTSSEQAAIFKSIDGGSSWVRTSFQVDHFWVTDLVIDPLAPNIIYAGTAVGLFRSIDGGTTWSRAAGTLGYVWIRALAAASSDERTILYVGTTGGMPSGAAADQFGDTAPADNGFVRAGVYQQTVVHPPLTEKIYLPLVVRND